MLIFDIKHPVRRQIKAVSETTKRYYKWLSIFVRTSEYGFITVVAVGISLAVIPIIAFANTQHINVVKFTPTVVNVDPADDTGWQNVSSIQNIDLSNVAELSEFNGTNSTSLNAPVTPPVTEPTLPETQPPTEETPPVNTESNPPSKSSPPTDQGASPGQIQLPEPAGGKNDFPPVPEAPNNSVEQENKQDSKDKKNEPSAWFNKVGNFLALLRLNVPVLAQTEENILPADLPAGEAGTPIPPPETTPPPTEETQPPAETPPSAPAETPSEPQPEVILPSVDGEPASPNQGEPANTGEPVTQPEIVLPSVDGELVSPHQGESSTSTTEAPQEQVSIFTLRKNLVISGFKPEEQRDAASVIDSVKLNLSMGISGRVNEDDELLMGYKVGDVGNWKQLESFTQDQDYSNSRNGDYFSYDLPKDTDIQNLKIEVFSLSNNDPAAPGLEPLPIYIDSAWVEVNYIDEVKEPAILEGTSEEDQFAMDYEKTPEFEFYFKNDEREFVDRLISLAFKDRNFKITDVTLVHESGFEYQINVNISQDADGKWTIKIPNADRTTIPGKYKIRITGTEDGQQYIEEQEFYWGVLAVNVNKSILLPGEEAYIQMAALTNSGSTMCNAILKLEITAPNGELMFPEVKPSGICGPNAKIVDLPDYSSNQIIDQVGSYKMRLARLDFNGDEIHHIFSSFEVQESVPFEVERIGPTRIFPSANYVMKFKIKANEDFTGSIIERVPNNFIITESVDHRVQNGGPETRISWLVNLEAGDIEELSYEFDAPDVSPEFYLLGPLSVGRFQEARLWQIASDAVSYIGASNLIATNGGDPTAITPHASSTTGDLLVFHHYGRAAGNDETVTISGFTNVFDSVTAGSGHVAVKYRIMQAGDTTFDASVTNYTSGNSGETILEWIETYRGFDSADPMPNFTASLSTWASSATVFGPISAPATATVHDGDMVEVFGGRFENVTAQTTLTGDNLTWAGRTRNDSSLGLDAGAVTQTGLNSSGSNQTITAKTITTTGTAEAGAGRMFIIEKAPPAPILTQNKYGWRDDTTALNTDGGYLFEDAAYSPIKKNTTTRLRVEIANTGDAAATSYNYRLQYALLSGSCGASTFADVPVTATTEPWEMVLSSQYADGDDITASHLTATGTFSTSGEANDEAVEDSSNQTAAETLTNAFYTEFEYAIQATNNAVDQGTYCFRLTNAGSTTNFSYSAYPQATLDVGGGRAFSSGFELQSVTAAVEWTTANGTPVINTTTRRGGAASLEISSLASTTQKRLGYQFKSANTNGPLFARAYINVSAAPSAENRVISFRDSGETDRVYITLDSGRLLRLYDEDGVIGSASSALTLNTWYRVELKISAWDELTPIDTIEAKLDGTNIATSATRNLTNGVTQIVVGGNLAGEAQTTGAWYFDDVAVNEDVGSSQNSYPGAGTIAHLRPNVDGDTVTWTNTYTNMDEVTPNDATDAVTSSTVNQIEEANLFDPDTVGIRPGDTVNVLQVGSRFRSSSATNSTATVRIKSASNGTLLESSAIATNGTTWFTNATAAPQTYPLSSYTKPEGGVWTSSDLNTAQIGAKLTVDGGTNTYQISTLWLLVEYVPTSNPPLNQTQYDSTHDTVIATGGTTADGVTNNIYLSWNAVSSFIGEILTPKVEVRNTSTSLSNVATNTGTSLVTYDSQSPIEIRSTCIVKDTLNNQLVMWGGNTGTSSKAPTNDTWVMSLQPGHRSQWRLLTTSGTKPQVNRAHVCVYDSLNDRLVVFGGWDGSTYLNSAWFLSLPSSGTPAWTNPSVTGSPASGTGQLQAVAIYDDGGLPEDATVSRMVVYGGYFSTDTDIDQVYELTLPTSGNPTWNQIIGTTAGTPSASGAGRDGSTLVFDSDSNRAVLYGGHSNANTAEVWSLGLPVGGAASWTQITPTGSPGTKIGHMAGFQPDYSGTDDRMIIFDGTLSTIPSSVADVWELTLPESGTSVWTDKSPAVNNRTPGTSFGGLNGVYDADGPNGPRMIFIPGYDGTIYDSALPIAIDLPASGSFEYKKVIDVRRYPTASDQMGTIYDAVNKDIITFGGACCGDGPGYAFHTSSTQKLRVTDSTPTWRDAGSDMGPLIREGTSSVYDSTSGGEKMVTCFGLSGQQPNYLADCWKLSLPTSGRSTWTNLSPAGTPPGDRWGAVSVYDDLNDRMVVFGGQGGSGNTYLNNLNFLSLGATPTWSVPTVTGSPPGVRRFSVAVYDPGRDRMIIFGGENSTALLSDVWELTLPTSGNPTWTQLSPTGSGPSARRGHNAVYDTDRGDGVARMVVFGGTTNTGGTTHSNEAFELTLPGSGDGVWTALSPTGTAPIARRSAGTAYDSQNDRMILIGGRDGDTTRFFGETFALTLGSTPAWSNLNPDKSVPVTVAVTGLSAGTNYHWQSWTTGTSSNDSTLASYGGNSDTPTAGTDFGITSNGITVSGNVFNNPTGGEPTGDANTLTDCDGSTQNIALRANGTTYTTTCSNTTGAFSFTSVSAPSGGAGMVIWIDNTGGTTQDGAMVIRYDGTGDSTGLVFWENAVTLTSDNTDAVTIANMDIYDSGDDADIPYTATATPTLVVNNGFELHVTTAKTFTPGGTVTTDPSGSASSTDGDVHIDGTGTLSMEANALSVGGDFNNEGTMTFTSNQTTTFAATGTGFTITDGGENFENIVFDGSSGGWSFADSTTLNKDLTMTNGTLSGTNDITVTGNVNCGTSTCGTITLTAGTFLQSVGASAKNFGTSAAVSTNWKFFNLTFTSNTGVVITTSSTGTGTIEVSNALTISTNSTLNAGNRTYILSGAIAAPFVKTGTFQYSTGTMRFTGNSASVVVNALSGSSGSDGYYNLEIKPGGAVTYTLATGTYQANNNLDIGDGAVGATITASSDPTINVGGNFTINTSATFVASSSATLSVKGNWLNSGTFTHSSGTVQLNGTATGKTINTGGTGTGKDFFNLIFNGSGGAWSPLTSQLTVTGDLTMTAGTLDNTGGSADVVVNGAVAGTNGIINLTAGTFEQRVTANKNFGTTSTATAWIFNNLTFSNGNGGGVARTITTQTGGTGNITLGASGILRIGKSGDVASDTTILDAGNRTWELQGTGGDPFQILASPAGNLTPATSTFLYTGNNGAGNTTVQSETYNVLQVNNGSEIYALEGTTAGATVTITAGTLDTGANALSATGDLTVTGTLQGTGNVTINGNITGAGTVNMTGGTFEQIVAADKTFGSSSGTNEWIFSGLKFNNSDGAAAHTITPNAGTGGTITVSGTLTLGDSGTQNITFDDETSNDRVFNIDGSMTISTKGIFSASSTTAFTLAGNLTDNKSTSGGFTPNSGTVTVDGAGTSTFAGANTPAITFFNLTSTTAGKTLAFTEAETFRTNGKFTITGTNGNQIHIHSTSTTTQWLINHQGTEDVTYAHIDDSGCAGGTTNISLNTTSTDNLDNDYTCWLFPSLSFTLSDTSVSMNLVGPTWTNTASTTATVSSRSEFGYQLTAYITDLLRHTIAGGITIPNYTDGGSATYANPTTWTTTCVSDTNKCGFGYNTNDADISQFAANEFAPFSQTAPGDAVASSASDVVGEAITLSYRTSVSLVQQAGSYLTTIIYILTPQF